MKAKEMGTKKRILVIGGGFTGLGSIKLLKEEGHEPVCYEKTDRPGGTWNYREDSSFGIPSTMPTTIINHSKEMGALSDYPPDKKYPNYMRHFELYKLFTEVGEKFDCFRYVTYNREVIMVTRSSDYDATGKWDAKIKNTETGEVTDDTFDGVMVGVGHITYPKMAEYPGMDKYRGVIMHTHSLKRVDRFTNKKVVIVGIGCSGLDAAVDISSVASQVYLSTRDGAWILPRLGPYGLPFDLCVLRRYSAWIQDKLGYKTTSWILEKLILNRKFNHSLYKLKPSYHMLEKDPVTNDFIGDKILSGSVVVRKNIKCFTETGVIFVDETEVTNADFVIMATGYTWQFPFLENDTVVTENGRINLYKCIYPPQLKHPTLAIVSFLLPMGPGIPLGEIQCRWIARVFSGKCSLPSYKIMIDDIERRHVENLKRYSPSEKMTIRVDYTPYLDEIAQEIGVKPNLWKYFFSDPELFKALVFGPALPYQYRLEGPHKWDGARKAILTVYDRVLYPILGEHKGPTRTRSSLATDLRFVLIFYLIALSMTQSESYIKNFVIVAIAIYSLTRRSFVLKCFLSLLLLPLFVPWKGFVSSYLITIFFPITLAAITSF